MNNVLFPTDFSDNALNAFDFACHYVQQADARLMVMNAFQVPVLSPNESGEELKDAASQITENRNERLRDFIHRYENDKRSVGLHDLAFELESMEGEPVESIVAAVERHRIDMVIMGTQGFTAKEDGTFGSTTAETLHRVICPIIAIPNEVRFRPLREIVYALDLKDAETESVNTLKAVADLFRAHITFLHIKSDPHYFGETQFENYQRTLHNLTDFENISIEMIENRDVVTGT